MSDLPHHDYKMIATGPADPAQEKMSELLEKMKAEIVGIQHRCKSVAGYIDRDRGDRMMALFEQVQAANQQPVVVDKFSNGWRVCEAATFMCGTKEEPGDNPITYNIDGKGTPQLNLEGWTCLAPKAWEALTQNPLQSPMGDAFTREDKADGATPSVNSSLALTQELELLRNQVGEWQSCAEFMPVPGCKYWITDGLSRALAKWNTLPVMQWEFLWHDTVFKPTHMFAVDLPLPPLTDTRGM